MGKAGKGNATKPNEGKVKRADKVKKSKGKVESVQKNKRKLEKTASNKGQEKIKLDESCIGKKIKVFWPDDGVYYRGKILSFDSDSKKHEIEYKDGVVEFLKISREKIEWVDDEEDDETARKKKKETVNRVFTLEEPFFYDKSA